MNYIAEGSILGTYKLKLHIRREQNERSRENSTKSKISTT